MKKIFSILFALLLFTGNALAAEATITNTKTSYNFQINYPYITLDNSEAADEINRFISKKLQAYRKVFNSRNYSLGIIDYKLMYEDDDFLSIVFTYWWYYNKDAHGMYNKSGIVFDKHTGKLVNLKNFVPDLNVKSLIKKINDGSLTIYNQNFEPITLAEPWQIERVSHSYYIDGDKTVYLIYQPYELASYSDGNTYIKITQDDAKKLKD